VHSKMACGRADGLADGGVGAVLNFFRDPE
jgi:hypothetical protein